MTRSKVRRLQFLPYVSFDKNQVEPVLIISECYICSNTTRQLKPATLNCLFFFRNDSSGK